MLYCVSYRLTPTGADYVYFYTHNWRGDIVGLYNGNGELRAKYTYDAWGNVTSITDQNGNAITSQTHVGNLNPFRYRGYYQDVETGFYYLMSRYYDTVTHRLINADDCEALIISEALFKGKNLFLYCNNNPIIRSDENGDFWNIVGGAIIGGLISGGIEIASQLISGKGFNELDWGAVGIQTVTGMATGALVSSGLPPVAVNVGRAVINTSNSIAHSVKNSEDFGTAIAKAAFSCAATLGVASIKSAGSQLTAGNHMKLNAVGKIVKRISKPPTGFTGTVTTTVTSSVKRTATNNIKSNKSLKSKKQTKYICCRGCGRPIGKESWMCHSGWTY